MQYIEIKESIVEQIASGVLLAGQKLPSERQLAESFNTTRVTLREALSILETNGLIYREDRRGWFIAFPRIQIPASVLDDIANFIPEDRRYKSQLLTASTVMATKAVNDVMDLPPFSKIHAVDVVHYIDERPVGHTLFWIKDTLSKDLINKLNESSAVLSIMSKTVDLLALNKHISVMIKGLEGDIAAKLRATEGTPSLFL
jgi:DNA-binding GntR family transcriptional regulator